MTELVDLLTGATARHALGRRDIAAVFGVLRDAGVSQVHIARATGQRQSEVSEIIAGRQVQSVALLERIADGLGVPRGWMGLAYASGLTPEPVAPDDAATEEERGRNLLRHAATVLWGTPIFGVPDPIRIHHAPTPVPIRVGLSEVEQVANTTDLLGQLANDLGGIPTTDALTAHARASEALFGSEMREPVRQRLLIALSDAHSAAGFAAAGAGLRDLARQHFTRGMDCAGEAGDLPRAAVSLDSLGNVELPFGQLNEALKLFQLGAATAPTSPIRAMLEYDCALALGLLGLTEEALAALRRARDTYKETTSKPRPAEHVASSLPHLEGSAYLALGHFDRAATALSTAVDGASHAVGCTTLNLGLLAAAQLRCGELRSGLRSAERAIGLAKGLCSVSVLARLAPLQEAAAARRDSACQDLANELATLRSAA